MRILITNDDSVSASQLLPLIRWCQKLGQVTTVVPKFEQSGKSHGIELHRPFEAKQVTLAPDVTVWAVDSTPADCVRFAVLGKKQQFDLVISGINKGLNMGLDILYSGTVAAICEAAALGIPAIAFSTAPETYEEAVCHLDGIWEFICRHRLLEQGNLYNINIPAAPKGFRFTRQGGAYYSDDFPPVGNDMYAAAGKCVHRNQGNLELDTDATISGYVSITPLTIRLNDMVLLQKLQKLNIG